MPPIPEVPLLSVCPQSRTAGVDWCRLIFDDFDDAQLARQHCQQLQELDVQTGSKVRRWRFQNYEGWQTDTVRWGALGPRILCETSGTVAPYTWDRLPRSGGRCTRLDLQQTLTLSEARPDFGMQFLQLGETIRRRPPQYHPKRGVKLETTGYWCGTVAPRTRPKHGRVYDKGIEQKSHDEGHVWRVEVELKYDLSQVIWLNLQQVPDVTTRSAALCRSLWESWGCYWPEPPATDGGDVPKPPARPAPTVEALGKWVTRTVAPTIPRLLTRYSVDTVLEMLGLTEYAVPRDGLRDDA
jgi:hypothetical protein